MAGIKRDREDGQPDYHQQMHMVQGMGEGVHEIPGAPPRGSVGSAISPFRSDVSGAVVQNYNSGTCHQSDTCYVHYHFREHPLCPYSRQQCVHHLQNGSSVEEVEEGNHHLKSVSFTCLQGRGGKGGQKFCKRCKERITYGHQQKCKFCRKCYEDTKTLVLREQCLMGHNNEQQGTAQQQHPQQVNFHPPERTKQCSIACVEITQLIAHN